MFLFCGCHIIYISEDTNGGVEVFFSLPRMLQFSIFLSVFSVRHFSPMSGNHCVTARNLYWRATKQRPSAQILHVWFVQPELYCERVSMGYLLANSHFYFVFFALPMVRLPGEKLLQHLTQR